MNYQMVHTFSGLFSLMEKDYSERTAFSWVNADGDGICSRTYGDYCKDVRQFVSCLNAKLDKPAGKHVAIISQKRYEYYVAAYACFLINCVLVPLNYQKDIDEILDEIQRADVSAVIIAPDSLEWLPELPGKYSGNLIDLFEYKEYLVSEINDSIDGEALAVILYTSGTTGLSKGVMLSNRNFMTAICQKAYSERNNVIEVIEKKDGELFPFFAMLPMFHISGMLDFNVLLTGDEIDICESPKYFLRDVSMLPSKRTVVVPAIFTSLSKEVRSGHDDRLKTLRNIMTVGAKADTEAISYLIDKGYSIRQGYAMTETAGIGTYNFSHDKRHICSIGKKEEAIQIKLDNGEVCFKGDTVFLGYYNDPEETSKVLDSDGWFHSGDLAGVDEDGYYYLAGRKKNLIILSNGENVNPEEIETKLYVNTDVLETVVKEKNGKIVAEVFCNASKEHEIEMYVMELNRTLPMYKSISVVEFRNTPFERTATGKIKR